LATKIKVIKSPNIKHQIHPNPPNMCKSPTTRNMVPGEDLHIFGGFGWIWCLILGDLITLIIVAKHGKMYYPAHSSNKHLAHVLFAA
jgi:hypothetical protein